MAMVRRIVVVVEAGELRLRMARVVRLGLGMETLWRMASERRELDIVRLHDDLSSPEWPPGRVLRKSLQ